MGQGQRQRDDPPSHQRTTIHRIRKKLAPTTYPSTIKSKPTNLIGNDQGDHAESRSGETHRGKMLSNPGDGKRYGRIKKDTRRTKGADGTISRVEIIGRTGERAEIRGFSEVSTCPSPPSQ